MGWRRKEKQSESTSLDMLALAYISDGVIILSDSGKIRLINPVASRLIGQSSEEVVGVNFGSAIHLVNAQGKEVDYTVNPITIALKKREPAETKNLWIMPVRADKPVPISLNIALSPHGSAILTLRDITRDLKEEAERNDFISTASHEMRTPVASIEGYLGLAINPQTATIDERARGYLEQAHAASQHLGKLFQDLLDTTRLDDGHLTPRLVPTEIGAVVKEIADNSARAIAEKGLTYTFDSGGIAGSRVVAPVLYAMVDVDFLREILDNLIGNAVKYTKHGNIRVSIRGESANIIICVADTGIGISSEDTPHIFQKFYRADNSDTRVIGGTGLGLYIVKQRVEALGGHVWAISKLGQGTEFFVSLPRLSETEYRRRMLVLENANKMVAA